MVVINVELPVLLLLAAALCALGAWLLGSFTSVLRGHRYRVALGVLGFAMSGFMGFFCALKLETTLFPEWLAAQSAAVLPTIAYTGYLLFGFLGCWTAVRVAGPMDRKHTLSVLYSLVEKRKKTDAN